MDPRTGTDAHARRRVVRIGTEDLELSHGVGAVFRGPGPPDGPGVGVGLRPPAVAHRCQRDHVGLHDVPNDDRLRLPVGGHQSRAQQAKDQLLCRRHPHSVARSKVRFGTANHNNSGKKIQRAQPYKSLQFNMLAITNMCLSKYVLVTSHGKRTSLATLMNLF